MSEGTKRLAIFLGGLGALVWLTLVGTDTKCFTQMDHSVKVWGIILGVSVLCFLGAFSAVHAVAWVIRGFKDPKDRRSDRLSNPQGGANGRQPSGSEPNRTSAAAASRRSP